MTEYLSTADGLFFHQQLINQYGGSGADIANGEHAGHSGFERTVRWGSDAVRTDEAFAVELEAGGGESACIGRCANKQEQMSGHLAGFRSGTITPSDGRKDAGITFQRADLCLQKHFNVGLGGDALTAKSPVRLPPIGLIQQPGLRSS